MCGTLRQFAKRIFFLPLAVILAAGIVAVPGLAAEASNARGELILHVFTRSDSAICQMGVEYANQLAQQRKGLVVDVHDLAADSRALAQFQKLAARFRVKSPTLPAFYVVDQLKLGFTDPTASGPAIEALLRARLFVRSGCGRCRAAKRFFDTLEARWPALEVVYYDLGRDAAAQATLQSALDRYNRRATGTPVIDLCGGLLVGYDSDATTGRQIEDLLRQAAEPLSWERKGADAEQAAADTRVLPELLVAGFGRQARIAVPAVRSTLAPPIGPSAPREPRRLGMKAAGLSGAFRTATPVRYLVEEDEEPPTQVPALELPPAAADNPEQSDEPLVAPAEPAPVEGIEVPWLGYVRVERWGLPAFTLLIGTIDGFNPCAMWVLVFLLSVLVNLKSRAKMLAVAGTFIVVSGLAYFAFMAAWLNLFVMVGLARPLQIVLGFLAVLIGLVNAKDFFALHRGITFSIPEAAKPTLYAKVSQILRAKYLSAAVAAAVVLAVMVNVVEVLCTAGLPALYAEVLRMQDLSWGMSYAYLALYNLAYMFDDTILLALVVLTLSRRRLQEREGRWLKLVSGLVMLALGIVMLVRPDWLQFATSGSK